MHLYFNALKYRCISLWENIDAFPSGKTDPIMHWNKDSSWICSPRAPEVDLIKAVNMSPWHYTIFIVYKIKCCFIDRHVVFIYQLHTLSSLRLRNEPRGPMNRALCETRFYVWIFFEKKKCLDLAGSRNTTPQSNSLWRRRRACHRIPNSKDVSSILIKQRLQLLDK
jgi:hypothetical protein